MFDELNDENFMMYAMKCYETPHCVMSEFEGDIKRVTYCMKDVYNWKIYCDLFDSFQKIDYTQLSETEDNTAGIEEISCAGGACLL